MQNQSNVKMNQKPEAALVSGSILSKSSHVSQVTKIFILSKSLTIERYGIKHLIEYCYKEGELELWMINGDPHIEDNYTTSFIEFIEEQINQFSASSKDNDEEYDDWFQTGV